MKLRIWWLPNVPGTPFYREVKDLEEAKRLLNTLVDYTRYLEHRDMLYEYDADTGGVQMWVTDVELPDGGEWVDAEYELGVGGEWEYERA